MWFKLRAYCDAFAPWIAGVPRPHQEPVDREQLGPLVEVAERYGTGPALAWLLQQMPVNAEVEAYARLSLLYGRERATRRAGAIRDLSLAMNNVGTAPLLLKGSAAQIGGVYPDSGFRLMADIDLLVPEVQFQACERAAEAIGFKLIMPIGPHHANQQYHEGLSTLLELHRRVTRWHGRSNFPAERLLETARPAEFDGAQILLPDWTLHAVLAIVHAFVWDECRHKAHVPLKTMLDLAALRVAAVVDWAGVDKSLRAMGERQALIHVDTLFSHLFSQPLMDVHISRLRRRAILLWYRLGADYFLVSRTGAAMSALRRRYRIAAKEPARLRKLATPGFYFRLWRSLREAFDRRRPLM